MFSCPEKSMRARIIFEKMDEDSFEMLKNFKTEIGPKRKHLN